jgi:pimeloyl-ACP methyl ester carboxylesterase
MWTSAVGIGMGAWALGIGAAVVAQRRLIFRPPVHLRTLVAGPHADTYRIKPMSLPVGDGAVLEGWRSIRRQGKSRSGTLLYFGGRGENVGWAPHMSSYFLGWSVVAFNYRGFGRSTGQATEARTVLDSRRIFDACSQPEEGQAPMVLMGRSLGTAVAIRLASVVAPDRLVLL